MLKIINHIHIHINVVVLLIKTVSFYYDIQFAKEFQLDVAWRDIWTYFAEVNIYYLL